MYHSDLSIIDYRILAFFKIRAHSSLSDAASAMPDVNSMELRVTELVPKYLSEDFEKQLNDTFTAHQYIGTFCITPLGEKVLQDFETAEKKRQKEIWLVNAKIPIIVSFITTIGLHLLLWLLPLILQWFANFL